MTSRHQLLEAIENLRQAERGTLFKTAPFRVALSYPSPYHVGMSSLGFQTVYAQLNSLPGVSAERIFLPDNLEAFEQHKLEPVSVETLTPLSAFSMLAFSVAYELELGGLFSMLHMAQFPLLREERDGRFPLVIAGGPLTFSNPDPLEPFVDVLVQGEAEDVLPLVIEAATSGSSRDDVLRALAKVPGLRVPAFSAESTRYFVAKASDEKLPAHSQIVTPNTELRDMFLIEPERGCSRGCHYCVMRRTTNGGMRTVAPERVMSFVPDHATKVGFVGAAVTDHPKIIELLETVVKSGRGVGVSSLRADRLSQRLVNALQAGGSQVLTVASDGPSQRLRDLVDRKHSEAQIIAAAQMAKAAKMKRLKVYNIVGLPTETDADIAELVRFTTELSKIMPVALGVAPFAAKRNTPLDGAPFAGINVIEDRLEILRKGLRGRAEVRPTSARWAWVEYMLAQTGPEGGLAAMEAWKNGGGFSAWKKAFEKHSCTPSEKRRTVDGRRNSVVWPSVGLAANPG
jgi:radical SAM superfamily enzyme YgiQ (UPF0313 family)